MTQPPPNVWQADAALDRVKAWQQAVIAGRLRVADFERRATYPANPDPDTVAIAEHYRIRWHQARILKAMSYFMAVSPADLAAVTGIHPALLKSEVRRVADRTTVRMQIDAVHHKSGIVAFFRLGRASDRDEIRAVIQSAWQFSETFAPQSRGKADA
jgi:hypothetical protein